MSETHWSRHATQWNLFGQPLLPGPEDIAAFEENADRAAAEIVSPQALVLGVTPQIMGMRWPRSTRVTGCDRLLDMIRRRRRGPADQLVCADWLRLPFGQCSHDIAIGDNALNVQSGAEILATFVAELHRVLRPGAWLILRISLQPDTQENAAAIFEDLRSGRIGSFHAFKWRLAMALQRSVDDGVRLADVWETWHAEVPEPDMLMRNLGWDPSVVKTMDAYRDVRACYTFPTLREARAIFDATFQEQSCRAGAYELGERCPIFAMRRR